MSLLININLNNYAIITIQKLLKKYIEFFLYNPINSRFHLAKSSKNKIKIYFYINKNINSKLLNFKYIIKNACTLSLHITNKLKKN